MSDCMFCSPWLMGVVLFLIITRIWLKLTTGRFKENVRMRGITAIVTGANSGIGAEVVRDFARRGARVVMACRDMKKAEKVKHEIVLETNNNNISLKHIDFASLASVRQCAKEILAEESSIHILLNNAAVMAHTKTKTDDGIDTMMQINHFGPFLFTNLLLARLKESAPSRIVNVASDLYKLAANDLNHPDLSCSKNATVAYGTSKFCSILSYIDLAEKLRNTGVTVNSVTPGVALTDINRDMAAWMRIPWNFICKYFMKSAEEGAQTLIYASISPAIKNETGNYYKDCELCPFLEQVKIKSTGRRIWDHSEKVVALKDDEKFY